MSRKYCGNVTVSRRRRAGSRRNKKHKDVGSFWDDETGLHFHVMDERRHKMTQVDVIFGTSTMHLVR